MGDTQPATVGVVRDRVRRALPSLTALVVFIAALEVLRHELQSVSWHALTTNVLSTPPRQLGAALVLTALNYLVLTGYDLIAFTYIAKTFDRWRIVCVSFLAYAVANNVGFAAFSGAAVRFRFYARWGLTTEEISRIVFSYSVTFWLGLLALGGFSLAFSRLPSAYGVPGSGLAIPVGWLLVAASLGYVGLTVVRRGSLRVYRFSLPLPRPHLAIAQLAVSCLDWVLAGAVFYVLLPPSDASFVDVLGAFLAAQLIGLASHVPGGVGVFEGLIVLLLKPFLTSGQLLPALVVYRAVYYVLPLGIAMSGLLADEIGQRRTQAARAGAWLGRVFRQFTPRLLAVFTFLAGLLLLVSGATPAAEGRLAMLAQFIPLGVVETSHFIGSLVGVALLLLSHGLYRRLDSAYYLTLFALGCGISASLLKGVDYEEAILLGIVLAMLARARPAFDRRAALLATRFSPAWFASVVAAVAASVWLGSFAFKHVAYSHDLWWQFELDGEPSRFLRASVGVTTAVLFVAFARLMRPAPPETDEPTEADLNDAARAIANQHSTFPFLAYLRDKTLLFNDDRTGFVMYSVQGRSWVALGDPVGPPDRLSELIRLFLERCDDFGGTPVFYQVRQENLHLYADFGLTFAKLGEEAKVDLASFTLQGSRGSRFRQAISRLERDQATCRVVPASDVPSLMPDLRAVSDDWLAHKAGGEKGFSLGFFDPEYIARFPVAVVERSGHVQAFANLWVGPDKQELSIDLMRYHRDGPKGAMEAMLAHLLQWGKSEGYRWFMLGMAPLSGFETSPVAPLWTRLGEFLYQHGGALYNFQGLRAYKEKFDPIWESHYLAYPGGLGLPRILADVSALIAGGYRRILLK